MNGMLNCSHCGGTGKIEHVCQRWDLKQLETLLEDRGRQGNWWYSELLYMGRCKKCGQLWKVWRRWDSDNGLDEIWLLPGESERGYEFTEEEARKYVEP